MFSKVAVSPNYSFSQSQRERLSVRYGAHVIVSVGSLFMNVGNFATSLLAARLLNRSTFSSLVALQALLTIITTIVALSQPLLASAIARQPTKEAAAAMILRVTRTIFSVGLTIALLWLIGSPIMSRLFGSLTFRGIVSGALFILFATLMSALLAVAQGNQDFVTIALALSAGGLGRPLLFLLAFSMSPSVWSSVLSFSLTCLLVSMVLVIRLGLSIKDHFKPQNIRSLIPASRPHQRSLSVLFLMAIFSYVDVFIARVMLPDDAAGDFAVAALLTNICLYIGWIVGTVLVPLVASKRHHGVDEIETARQSVLLVSLSTTAFTFVLTLFAPQLLRIVAGSPVTLSRSWVCVYSLAFAVLALLSLSINFEIAKGTAGRNLPEASCALLVYVACVVLFDKTPEGLILTDLISFVVFLTLANLRKSSLLRIACIRSRRMRTTIN